MHMETSPALARLNTAGSRLICQQGSRRLPPFTFIKVGMMFCICLEVTVALLLVSLHLNAVGLAQGTASSVNGNCTLIVPANPLSARGLATPYLLVATDTNKGLCHEANPAQSAFVQGAIFNLATGQISVYDPLVVDEGTKPALPPTPVDPRLLKGAIVALWFGFNGVTLRLQGTNNGLKEGRCVDGVDNSPFGQFAYCDAADFFLAANRAIRMKKLVPPPLGFTRNGLTCPSTRDFSVVDQDQSDNVTTSYLALANGRTAQDTVANRARLQNFIVLVNPSDNKLLVGSIYPALGCNAWMAPNLANKRLPTTALPLNELQASVRQRPPVALVPAGDPMVLVNGQPNLRKLNLFRIGVDQPPVASLAYASTVNYCLNLLNIGAPRLFFDAPLTKRAPSPNPAMANNLFAFLALRFNTTWGANGLNCMGLLGRSSPIIVISNGQGVAINAIIKINKSRVSA